MRLAATQEIAVPIHEAWDGVVDVERMEGAVRARDPGLRRIPNGSVGEGTRWESTVPVQGKPRRVVLELLRLDPPHEVRLRATVDGIEMVSQLRFDAPAPDRTRLALDVQARSTGLGGRMLLGALGLARPRIERRLEERLAAAARRIEAGRRTEQS